jgi:hypothetical protein
MHKTLSERAKKEAFREANKEKFDTTAEAKSFLKSRYNKWLNVFKDRGEYYE